MGEMSDWLLIGMLKTRLVWAEDMIEKLEYCIRIMARKHSEDAWKLLKILEEK